MTPAAISSPVESFSAAIRELDTGGDDYVPHLVDAILARARQHRASDIHLVPDEQRMRMLWRIDGVLHRVADFDGELSPRIVARLKVLAGLLTYRTDLPQEGRISATADERGEGETRITTFPTLYGEKAAVRLFADSGQYQLLADVGLPDDIRDSLSSLLNATSGVILLTGPSGSGKTTTIYACLREIVRQFGESKGLMSLEDPIEVVVPGITQSQVRLNVGFDLATGLRSMMRQDPDVIMVGEIRDPETAEAAFQVALTGHLVLTTFHAGSSVEAVTRLLDMGIEPYLLRSTLQTVVCQRLLRRACVDCCRPASEPSEIRKDADFEELAHKPGARGAPSQHCPTCGGVGYHGRFVTAEMLDPNHPDLARAIVNRIDSGSMQTVANQSGMITLRQRVEEAVRRGITKPDEAFRVLGSV